MEYVDFLGTYADIPVTEIVEAWKATYGPERVRSWIDGSNRPDEAHFS